MTMRNRLFALAVMAASGMSLAALPVIAEAAPKRVLVCKNVRNKANTGTVIGAVGGGLLGHTVAGHGDKTAGTLIGAGAGAVAGHEIAKSNAKKKRCHYEYR
jgi:outer membrane lipoprotein SlyB